MVTAETITDEQIRELRVAEAWGNREPRVLQAAYNALRIDGGIVGLEGFHAIRESQADARARCAEIINARTR